MRKKIALVLFIIIFPLLLCGCYDRLETNQTVVSAGVGIDLNREGRIDFTVQLNKPVDPQKTTTFTQQVENISAEGDSITEAARRTMLYVPRVPLWSHADIFVIGGSLAQNGLGGMPDFVSRNRNIRHNIIVLVSPENKPEEIFKSSCPLSLCSSRGVLRILKFQEKMLGCYTSVDMLHFFGRLATPGIDPLAPQVVITKDIKGNNILTIEGMAVFSGDKMAGSLDARESRGYRFMYPKDYKGGILTVKSPFNPDDFIDLEISHFKSSIKPVKKDDKIIIRLETELDLNIFGIQAKEEILTTEKITDLEKAAQNQVKEDITACVEKAKKLNSDIFGFGQSIYRYMPKEWEKLSSNWEQVYPDIDYEVKVKTKIKNAYFISKVYLPKE